MNNTIYIKKKLKYSSERQPGALSSHTDRKDGCQTVSSPLTCVVLLRGQREVVEGGVVIHRDTGAGEIEVAQPKLRAGVVLARPLTTTPTASATRQQPSA
jgi:hypothetical protein